MSNHLYAPITRSDKLNAEIREAQRRQKARESKSQTMVEAFEAALERKNGLARLQREPMSGNLQRAFG